MADSTLSGHQDVIFLPDGRVEDADAPGDDHEGRGDRKAENELEEGLRRELEAQRRDRSSQESASTVLRFLTSRIFLNKVRWTIMAEMA